MEKQVFRVGQRYYSTAAGSCERGLCTNLARALLIDQHGWGMQACEVCMTEMTAEGILPVVYSLWYSQEARQSELT